MASWLRTRGRSPGALTVGSKWGYRYVGDWRIEAPVQEVKDHSLGALRRQAAESLGLLDSHLALYQIHFATLETGVLDDVAVLSELASLRGERGLVIGLTTSGPGQSETIRHALEAESDGVNPFSCVQSTWNLFEPSSGPALAEAHDAGWGVIVKEGVANGRLTPRERDPEFLARREPLDRVARDHEVGVDAVALGAVLAQPWADVALSGAATIDQLHDNLGALEVSLSHEDLTSLAGVAMEPDDYWSRRAGLPWT